LREGIKPSPTFSWAEATLVRVMNVYEAIKLDGLVKSPGARIFHFEQREKSFRFKALSLQDFSFRSK
jgi:hypothetical protein